MTQRKFAVFDIDGTLIRWQLYHAVVDRLAKQEKLGPAASQALYQARMKWKRREHPDSFKEYEAELIKIYEAALAQLSPKEFDAAVKDIASEYRDQVYTYTRDLATQLKAAGYMLLAISGSQQEVVEQIANLYGFDDHIGSIYQRQDGRFTGQSQIASKDKRRVLKQLIAKHSLTTKDSWAVGDTISDAAMLAMVDHPVAFNPDRQLFEQAQAAGWPIVIERKNVVYQLEASDGRYLLAKTN